MHTIFDNFIRGITRCCALNFVSRVLRYSAKFIDATCLSILCILRALLVLLPWALLLLALAGFCRSARLLGGFGRFCRHRRLCRPRRGGGGATAAMAATPAASSSPSSSSYHLLFTTYYLPLTTYVLLLTTYD